MKEKNLTKGNVTIRRVISWLLTLAMILSGFNMIPGIGIVAHAANTTVVELTGSTTLEDGKVYVVKDDLTINANGTGASALTVASSATTYLYIPKGKTLTVNGSNGSGTTGGGAGIYLPGGSTLYVIGDGTLNANGGDGGTATNGGNADNSASYNPGDSGYDYLRSGKSGNGGNGAGGAGAGIGTSGGTGAAGGASVNGKAVCDSNANPGSNCDIVYQSNSWGSWRNGSPDYGNTGNPGGNGNKSSVTGRLYVFGDVTVVANGGTAQNQTQTLSGGNAGNAAEFGNGDRAGQSAGGASGGTSLQAAGIGSGAPGAPGGGSGGSAGLEDYDSSARYNLNGGGGTAPDGGRNGSGTKQTYGGTGGAAGTATTGGSAGNIMKVATATVTNGTGAVNENRYGNKSSETTISETEYKTQISKFNSLTDSTVTFMDGEETLASKSAGFDMDAPVVNVPSKDGFVFQGFYTMPGNEGTKIYGADGSVELNVDEYVKNGKWRYVGDVTLYAHWIGGSTITFKKNDGTDAIGSAPITIAKGDAVADLTVTAPSRTGFTFDGYWTTDSTPVQMFDKNGKFVTGEALANYVAEGKWNIETDVTLNAKWIKANSTIKFFNDITSETPASTIKIEAGNNVSAVKVPTKVGAEFLGYWTKGSTDPVVEPVKFFDETGHPVAIEGYIADGKWISGEDVELYAKWKTFTDITFDKNADDAVAGTTALKVYTEDVAEIETLPTREGYSFAGYYLADDETTADVDESTIQIFGSNGLVASNAKVVIDEDTVVYTDGEGEWAYTGATLKLYAHWTKGDSKVSFYDDKNSLIPSKVLTFAEGDVVNSRVTVPSKDGYSFMGYYLEPIDDINTVEEFEEINNPESDVMDMAFLNCFYTPEGRLFTTIYDIPDNLMADYIIKDVDPEDPENVSWKWNTNEDVELYAWWIATSAYESIFNTRIDNAIIPDYFDKLDEVKSYDDINNKETPFIAYGNKEVVNLKVPTREGYIFDGYYDALEGGTQIYKVNEAATEVVPVAMNVKSEKYGWIIKDGKWSFKLDIGKALFTIFEEDLTAIFDLRDSFPVLYAHWIPETYTFTFKANGGTGSDVVLSDVTIVDGYPSPVTIKDQVLSGKAIAGYATTKTAEAPDAYEVSETDVTKFNVIEGIDKFGSIRPTGDMTFYAVWADAKYNIAYFDKDWANINLDDAGSYNSTNVKIGEDLDVTYGNFMVRTANSLELETTHDVYEFKGWSTTPNSTEVEYRAGYQYKGGLTTKPGETVNLYAVWVRTSGYKISYNGNVNDGVEANGVPADDEITKKTTYNDVEAYWYKIPTEFAPEREGYEFLGWAKRATETDPANFYLSKEGDEKVVEITEDTTFYAQWEKYPVVTYDTNGGSFKEGKIIPAGSYAKGTENIEVEKGSETVERTGYTFAGWKTEDLGNNPITFKDDDATRTFTMPHNNVVFTAQWTINTETVSVTMDPAGAYSVSGTYKTSILNKETGIDEVTIKDLISDADPSATGYTPGKITANGEKAVNYGSEINFSVEVDEKYNSDNLTVTVKGASGEEVTYKPNTVVGAVYTYTISDVTENITISISQAVKKNYDIHYVYAKDGVTATLPVDAVASYDAGDTPALPTISYVDGDLYEFVGWYETEAAAEAVTKANQGSTEGDGKVTAIASTDRSPKTFYAAWKGKSYTIKFHAGLGATGTGSDVEKTQSILYGTNESLKLFTAEDMYPNVKGPNNVAFLGWTDDAAKGYGPDKEVKYTDGEAVLDMLKESTTDKFTINLYAVWDIDTVTVTVNSGEGKFIDGNVIKQQEVPFGSYLNSAIEGYVESDFERIGFGLGGQIKWAYIETPNTQIAEPASEQLLKNVTVTPIWEANTFTLTYYIDSTNSKPVDVKYGSSIKIGYVGDDNLAESFAPTNGKLIGWTKTQNSSLIAYIHGETILFNETATATLYPVFGDAESHYITYDINGGKWDGNTPAATELTGTSVALTTMAKSRTGYEFAGWAKSATATTAEYTTTYDGDMSEDIVLHAVWTPHKYTIKFEKGSAPTMDATEAAKYANSANVANFEPKLKNGVVENASQEFTYGTASDLQEVQYEFPGYTFVGWADKADATKTVIFNDKQSIKNLTDAENNNYMTLVAVWVMDTPITVTYNTNSGIGPKPDNAKYIKLSENILINVDTSIIPKYDNEADADDNCVFLGWSDKQNNPIAAGETFTPATGENFIAVDASAKTITVTDSTTLYAVWQKKATYKVTYDANGGIGAVPKDDKAYIAGSTDAAAVNVLFDKIPTRVGYEFVGWADTATAETAAYTDTETGTKTFAITQDTTLYAVWTPISYKVEYYNGATKIGDSLTFNYDQEITISDGNDLTIEAGFKFSGWSFKAENGTVSYTGGEKVKNLSSVKDAVIKLYAVTEPKTYLITLDDNIGIAENLNDENKAYKKVNVKSEKKDETDTTVSYYLKYQDSLVDITSPSMRGYTFEGYKIDSVAADYYDADGNVVNTVDAAAIAKAVKTGEDEVITMKAGWTPHEFNVIFEQNEKELDRAPVVYGEDFTMPKTIKDVALSNDFKVIGWTPDIELSKAMNSEEIAELEANDKIFYVNKTYEADILAALYNNDRADLTFYPVYKTTVKYNIYFSAENESVTNLPETQEVAWGDTFEVKFDDVVMRTPRRIGYTFLGWTTDLDAETVEFPYAPEASYKIQDVEDDITLYAVWQANAYNIAYYNGGEEAEVIEKVMYPFNATEVVEEELVDAETPYTFLTDEAKDVEENPYFVGEPGYVLVGWSLDEKAETVDFALGQKLDRALATEEDDTINVYAVWSASTYNVVFNNNSENVPVAEGTMNNQVMTYDIKVALDKNQFTAEGYEFAGWSLDKDANVASFKDEENVDLDASVEDASVTLYAIWTPVIKTTDMTEKYVEDGWNITEMFDIPELAGEATYALTETEGAALSEDNILTATLPGTYEITVTTAAANGITEATAKATFTVELAIGTGTLTIYDGEGEEANDITFGEIAFIDAANVTPVITITSGNGKLEELGEITYEFKIKGQSDEEYSEEIPLEAGEYVVRATVADGTLYKGFIRTASYKVVEKLQAAGTVATYGSNAADAEAQTEFVEAKDDIFWKVTFTNPTGDDATGYDPAIEYTFKKTGASDETYTDEIPTTAGKYTIRAVVADTDVYVGFTATANFEITNKVEAEAEVAIYLSDAADAQAVTTVPYADAAKITPKVTFTVPENDTEYAPKIKYEYKVKDAGDGTYTETKPTAKGEYTVRATIEETAKYLGTTAEADFEISDKLQAAGTVATFNGELQTDEFMEADNLVITPKMTYTVPEDAAEAEALNVTYTYKKAEASDSTYSDKQPTEVGEYTVRAVVTGTDKYVGFTTTANFEITSDPDKVEAAAKKAAVEKAEEDVQKRLQDTYDTLKNSNNYSDGQLAALDSAYATAKAAFEEAIDDITADTNIKSTGVAAAAEEALTAAKESLLAAVKNTAENEAADKAVADALANADAVLIAAEDVLENEHALVEDKEAVADAMDDVDTALEAGALYDNTATNQQKQDAAKALQDAVDALDQAVDTANLHAAIEAGNEQVIKQLAKDSLNAYADRIRPENMTEEEETAFNNALADAEQAIDDTVYNDDVVTTLADAKTSVKDTVDAINDTRDANYAVNDAKEMAEFAKQEAADAAANDYASEADKKALKDAEDALDEALEAFDEAETNDEKREAAEAVQEAVSNLLDTVNTANYNSANAELKAEEEAAKKTEEEAKKAAEAKALADAKEDAKKRLADVYDAKNLTDYRAAQQTELANAKNAGNNAIDAAKTPEEAEKALEAAKKAINAVKTDSVITKEEEEKAAEEKAAADKKAANEATSKINAIQTPITTASKDAIDAARKAYDSLTADQKKLVSNATLKKLTDAEAAYKAAVEASKKTSYSYEWVNGKWYNEDGTQTYKPTGSWKCNSIGWWYEDTSGWYPVSQWQKIDGNWYYFDASGYMASNEWRGGYWLSSNGAWIYTAIGSWNLGSGGWWFGDTTGWYAYSEWMKIDGNWYYFDADGYMVTDQYVDGYWLGSDGVCQ